MNKTPAFAPYLTFTIEEWARLRADEKMTLDAEDIEHLRTLNDPISLAEAEIVYLPLTRLLSFYVEAIQGIHHATSRFLGHNGAKVPFIIGVAGSVAVGKSTTARILRALLRRWPTSPKVDLVTTDGFLYPNAVLTRRGLMDRKGFPESYNRRAFVDFLAAIKSGRPRVTAPTYSHLVYDVLPDEPIIVENPDILIVEGLNILQPGDLPSSGHPIVFASDFIDFSIFIDADEDVLENWYVERFMKLRETAFRDPKSFFRRFAELSEPAAIGTAQTIWQNINLPNLRENILPTRGRADLILKKGADHAIHEVALRKV
ncbi:MAG TPA: type I pantothenate kinase [Pelagibacterium sp.]|uniref:type I pantothenate kinase n=1 Tax=Pelagibacterium sp. TaxID=1967288 RepID=UPI002B673FCF|nr:type I pantothenate kinase [Pelagibacterium sp.]HWJ88196.1 type I pantothenate kinase [Pelagibacterium sp.]